MKRITLALTATITTMFGATAAHAANCQLPTNANALASEIATSVNSHRRANGQPPLVYNPQLGQAAMNHACDMSQNGFFGHRGSDGSNSQARVRQVGYRDCIVAENLAWGYPQAQQIISGWMNSPGNRTNMLHPRIAEMGVGITQGPRGPNWVLVVARGC